MAKKKKTDTFYSTTRIGSLGTGEGVKGVPDLEFMSELEPPEGLKKFDRMRMNDPVVGGLLLQLESVISRLRWTIEGPNSTFVKDQLLNISASLSTLFMEMASAFTFGFYVGEEIWTVENGEIRLVDIEPRYQSSIEGIDDGIVYQSCDSGNYEIPLSKCIHFVPITHNRSPFGRSIIRHLYKPYYYKVAIEASEASGIDRDLAGLPKMTAPEGFDFTAADSSSANYNSIVKDTLDWAVQLVGEVRKDEQQGVVLPHGWEFELIRGSESRIDTSAIIGRYNNEMALGVLEGFLVLGAFASTNNANVELHVSNFLASCDGFAGFMANTLNKLVGKICRYNNKKNQPIIRFVPMRTHDLENLAAFLSRLVKNNIVTPTASIEEFILAIADLPYSTKEDEKKENPALAKSTK